MPTAGEIIETLRQDIVTRRRGPGEKLPTEKALAAHFAVSQPTIREAVRALDAMGLVDVRHGSGTYVRADGAYLVASALQTLLALEEVTVLDALAVRELLGRESVRLAAAAATPDDVAAVRAHLDALDGPLPSVEAIVAELVAFQVALSRASHNALLSALESFLASLLLETQHRVLRRRGAAYWRERSGSFAADRRAVLRAVELGNPGRAVRAMEAYSAHQREVFLADPDFARLRLSDDRAVRAVAELVGEGRGVRQP